ncbi:uncharacterized protein E0L32_010834 [Thyridium curvatum]|uniref:Uncharacterized protein n=1 Tax=Thyridium curvatum TaxID=1093900 RepID=A0A507ASP4_9PEZI|nr:uncharacterized protein E0L32_010834 [Thyridium curvatum]TPX07240.1 hypothetical protein E0L32_010834 [Thyridium curvatum]
MLPHAAAAASTPKPNKAIQNKDLEWWSRFQPLFSFSFFSSLTTIPLLLSPRFALSPLSPRNRLQVATQQTFRPRLDRYARSLNYQLGSCHVVVSGGPTKQPQLGLSIFGTSNQRSSPPVNPLTPHRPFGASSFALFGRRHPTHPPVHRIVIPRFDLDNWTPGPVTGAIRVRHPGAFLLQPEPIIEYLPSTATSNPHHLPQLFPHEDFASRRSRPRSSRFIEHIDDSVSERRTGRRRAPGNLRDQDRHRYGSRDRRAQGSSSNRGGRRTSTRASTLTGTILDAVREEHNLHRRRWYHY